MKVYPLRAAHGDAIILESEDENRTFRIVVDGGPEETQEAIVEHLMSLGYIDLLVLTHYDADHITGLLKYLGQLKGDECVVGRVWANCASIVDYDNDENVAAYEDAYVLSKHIKRLKRRGLIGEWNDNITTEMREVTIGPFRIDVLSPTIGLRDDLLKRYIEFVENEGLQDDPDLEENVSFVRVQRDAMKSLSELVADFRSTNTSFMNRSSIALRIQAEGKVILLLGDADAEVITDALSEIIDVEGAPMHVDLTKMSHHGSKANINRKLFELINCSRYLFTTNGGVGGAYHPDRQTIACIDSFARNNDNPIFLYFNYPLSTIMTRNVGLISDEEKEKFRIIDNEKVIMI